MKSTVKAVAAKDAEGLKTTTSVGEFKVVCDAPEDKARAFVELVMSRCPVHDTLTHGTDIVCTGMQIG